MMRHSSSLFLLAGFAAALLLASPMQRAKGGTQPMPRLSLPCPGLEALAGMTWLDSLHGRPDSALVMNWRALVAVSKGRALPSGC